MGKVWNSCEKGMESIWKMYGIHVEKIWNSYGKVWNPCEKCMESMEKRYGISIPYRIHIKLVYIPYGFHWNMEA